MHTRPDRRHGAHADTRDPSWRPSRRLSLLRPAPTRRDERGSISFWLVASSLALVAILGIAVDLSGQVHAKQHAQGVAAQAARVGAERVGAQLVTGDAATVNLVLARSAAQQYVRAAGMTGSVGIVDRSIIRVTTTETYTTRFLGLLGITRLRVTGEATAELNRTLGDVTR